MTRYRHPAHPSSSLRSLLLAGAATALMVPALPALAQDTPAAEVVIDCAADPTQEGCEAAVETPADSAPADAAPAETAPTDAAPAEAAPVAPTEPAPADAAPAADAPVVETPAPEAPAPEAPAAEVVPPVAETPAEAPADAAPAEAAPVETAPVAPAEPAPAAPVEPAPADAAPAAETPADTAPASEAPAADAPMTETPAVVSPAPETPAPTAETPAPSMDAAPTAEAPVAPKERPAAAPTAPAVPAPADAGTSAPSASDPAAAQQPAPAAAPAESAPAAPAAPAPAPAAAAPAAPAEQPTATAAPAAPAAPAVPTNQPQPPAPVTDQPLLDAATLQAEQERSARQAAEAALAAEQARNAQLTADQRDAERLERRRILGAAAAGAVVGAAIPILGGRFLGQQDDRVIIERNGELIVRSDPEARLREDGAVIDTEELAEGRSRTTVTRPNGVEIVTLYDQAGYPLRRTRRLPNGDEYVLFDAEADAAYDESEPFTIIGERDLEPFELNIPYDEYVLGTERADQDQLETLLAAPPVRPIERVYTVAEVTNSEALRDSMRRVDLDTITFATGSADVSLDQARALGSLGRAMGDIIVQNPRELYLIEGHTDAVGSDISNLALSDRRASSVASLLSDLYDVPPENLITQGYGEQYLKVPTLGNERANRRVTIRRITPLVSQVN